MNSNDLDQLFAFLDDEWLEITPDAIRIRDGLKAKGETFQNDHVAFRTFDDPRVDIATLAAPFLAAGYERSGEYVFEQKMLTAESFRPPRRRSGAHRPHVFISALDRSRIPHPLAALMTIALDSLPNLPDDTEQRGRRLLEGRGNWARPTWDQYQSALAHSEYAAWLWAFGIRANHFTVNVNALKTFDVVTDVNRWLIGEGFSLNGIAPFVQGDATLGLTQSSTKAKRIPWEFAEGDVHSIPSCYVEFAHRFPDDTGALFDGFVTKSADRIFESTSGSQRAGSR